MPLLLDFLRHGEALAAAAGGDAERVLSPAGERALRRLAALLTREGWRPDLALTSPLRRARETAAIVLSACAAPPALEIFESLAPDALTSETIAALALRVSDQARVLLVGHQPLIGQLCARLTGKEPRIAPGTLVRVACDRGFGDGAGRMVLTLPPERFD